MLLFLLPRNLSFKRKGVWQFLKPLLSFKFCGCSVTGKADFKEKCIFRDSCEKSYQLGCVWPRFVSRPFELWDLMGAYVMGRGIFAERSRERVAP